MITLFDKNKMINETDLAIQMMLTRIWLLKQKETPNGSYHIKA